MILVEHSKWLQMRLKYYELHQTPNERQKAKLIFCGGPHDLRPHHHGKSEKMRLRTRVWAQAPKPSSFAEQFIRELLLEVPLEEICIKNEKWKFFSRIRKLDVNIIWDNDRYVKASPGSTVQSYNNDSVIFDDIGRKVGSFWASKQIYCKKRISNFFENCRNLMFSSKISLWNVSESKEHIRNILPRCWLKYWFRKNEKNLCIFYEGK